MEDKKDLKELKQQLIELQDQINKIEQEEKDRELIKKFVFEDLQVNYLKDVKFIELVQTTPNKCYGVFFILNDKQVSLTVELLYLFKLSRDKDLVKIVSEKITEEIFKTLASNIIYE